MGDTISSDFSNRNNIISKVAKEITASRDILQILEEVFFGEYYFNALKLLRESMLISVLTNNLEVSFNLSVKDLKILCDVDAKLLRAAMKTSAKSSSILLLLELGLCCVEYILKKKRLGYLHHLLTVEGSPLVKQVFQQQVKTQTAGDWVKTVLKDLNDFNIELSF